MKIRSSFFFLILCLCFQPLSAQFYHGVNTAEISAQGSQSSTALLSKQWVCEYPLTKNVMTMRAKMASFGHNVDPTAKSVLFEVLFVEANPLIHIDLDFSQLMIQSGATREEGNLNLPVEIRFNERSVKTQAEISQFRLNPESAEMKLMIPLNLNEFGLSTDEKHTAHFSDDFVLKVENLQLKTF